MFLKKHFYPMTVGEVSANHGGSIERTFALMTAAQASGFDAVKFQTYTADEMTRPGLYKITHGLWKGRDLYDLYKQGSMPREWHQDLFDFAKEIGITAFSTAFSPQGVEFLYKLDAPAFKIASFEITYYDLIAAAAQTGKPVILSTGMSTEKEILDARDVALKAGCKHLYILMCRSMYPAQSEDIHLRTMVDMQTLAPEAQIGFSDHTSGMSASFAATALGAEMIEKHITISNHDGALDSEFSLPMARFKEYITGIREVKNSLGNVIYGPLLEERSNLVFRRSLHSVDGKHLVLRPNTGDSL